MGCPKVFPSESSSSYIVLYLVPSRLIPALTSSLANDAICYSYVTGSTNSLDLQLEVQAQICCVGWYTARLLLLLCCQLHLDEMFVFMGLDLKVRALEAGCVLTAEKLEVLAQRLQSSFPLNQQELAPKCFILRSAHKTHLENTVMNFLCLMKHPAIWSAEAGDCCFVVVFTGWFVVMKVGPEMNAWCEN